MISKLYKFFTDSRILILSLILMLSAIGVFGQPGQGGGPPGNPNCPRPPCGNVPITGIEILIAVGGLFGVKKLYQNRKSTEN
jgi:hypothetical protein